LPFIPFIPQPPHMPHETALKLAKGEKDGKREKA
jgi:hypothetical protein